MFVCIVCALSASRYFFGCFELRRVKAKDRIILRHYANLKIELCRVKRCQKKIINYNTGIHKSSGASCKKFRVVAKCSHTIFKER